MCSFADDFNPEGFNAGPPDDAMFVPECQRGAPREQEVVLSPRCVKRMQEIFAEKRVQKPLDEKEEAAAVSNCTEYIVFPDVSRRQNHIFCKEIRVCINGRGSHIMASHVLPKFWKYQNYLFIGYSKPKLP